MMVQIGCGIQSIHAAGTDIYECCRDRIPIPRYQAAQGRTEEWSGIELALM